MTAEQWQIVKEAFERARTLSAAEQEAYLRTLGVSDSEIADEVRALIAAYQDSDAFLETGAMRQAVQPDLAAAGLTLVGRRLGAYQVGALIGVGGMGEVYRGERADGEFTQRVAIKIVRGAADPAGVARFRAERQILAGLSHPNIARLFDGGTTDAGEPYFVMEYIDGQPIGEYCIRRNLDEAQRLRLFQSVLSAMDYAHRRGIVHRDIKPANIMVGEDGAPRLLDFGIAKIAEPVDSPAPNVTRTLVRHCTPDYASPEQLRNQPLTSATDIYSLGVVLFEVLTGVRWRNFKEGRSKLSQPLVEIVLKATRQDPSERYASAAEISAAIDQQLSPKRSYAWAAIAAAALLLVLAAATLLWRWRTVAAHGTRSIAVVEIENLSQDPSLDWMDRGVSEILTTGLAQDDALEVISTERVRNLIGRRVKGDARLPAAQMRDVAADARADAFVSGALLRLGPRLRLDIKVQDTASGKMLFTHRVEGDDPQSVFRMADEAATLVARRFDTSAARPATGAEVLTSNVEALKAYTEGMRYAERFVMAKALPSMRKAIELDPRFAMAHFRLAQFRGPWNPQLCREETQKAMSIAEGGALPRRLKLEMRTLYLGCNSQSDEALAVAQTVASENPHDAEAWFHLGNARFSNGDNGGMIAALTEALKLDPKFPVALVYQSIAEAYAGHFESAMDLARRYQETLEPGDTNGLDDFGDICSMFRRLDEAIGWYQKENHADKIALTAIHQGKYDLAESELQRFLAKAPASPATGGKLGFLGDVQVARGDLKRAAPYFEQGANTYGPQLWFSADVMFKGAQLYLEQGDPNGVLEFSDKISNPWRAGFRGIADLLLSKNAEAEVEFTALKTSISPVLGDVAARQYEQLYRGVAAFYGHRPADAIAALSSLPFSYHMLTALPLGRAYLGQGDLAHARAELDFVLKSQYIWGIPGWYERNNILALLLAEYYSGVLAEKQGRKADAVPHYREFYSHFERSTARLPQIASARTALNRLASAR